MFDRIHNSRRRLFLLLRDGDGSWVKKLVLLLGSYALCVLANRLFFLVMELLARKTGSVVAFMQVPRGFDRIFFLLVASMAPFLEEILFRLSMWYRQLLFAFLCFLMGYLLVLDQYIIDQQVNHNNDELWIYLQSTLAWGAATCMYVFGPAMLLQPCKGAKLRYAIYIVAGVLGLIKLNGYV